MNKIPGTNRFVETYYSYSGASSRMEILINQGWKATIYRRRHLPSELRQGFLAWVVEYTR
ncbi:hypothetical protein QE320_gp110 [Pseudomonas phage EM]|uniref:Uncharacterized protein n=1 Tax=Pseudomonas phage EM TaxID=2936914 RepID=A0AAE9KT22_9CAUD|nr:hypothetical protein QE320_gp110 [Pseudomonas phage EM]UPW35944.1 hypothetical protein EM_159 [Pseudomonas phage EM]